MLKIELNFYNPIINSHSNLSSPIFITSSHNNSTSIYISIIYTIQSQLKSTNNGEYLVKISIRQSLQGSFFI